MAEKKEGFGKTPEAPARAPIPAVFETPNYKVVVAQLSAGAADQAPELRVRYVVLSKRHPVIAVHSGLEGEAIAYCLTAEASLVHARQFAEEQEARGYAPPDGNEPQRETGGLNFPRGL